MAKLNYKELSKEFEKEFGKAYDGKSTTEDLVKEQEKISEAEKKRFLEAVNEATDAYIKESVEHFLKNTSRNIFEDGRYFYSTRELNSFLNLYTKKGGKMEILHVGKVYDKNGEFFCHEVCHKVYYENPSPYVLRMMEKLKIKKLFYS